MKNIYLILAGILLLTGCSQKSPEMIYTHDIAYNSHLDQYNADQTIRNHHAKTKELQGEVDDLMDDYQNDK